MRPVLEIESRGAPRYTELKASKQSASGINTPPLPI